MTNNEKYNEMPRAYFNRGYALILMHLRDHPDVDILEDTMSSDGFPIGKWLKDVRQALKYDKLDEKRKIMVESLGISFDEKMQAWELMYVKALDYYVRNNVLDVKIDYCTEDGVMLGAWIDRQKKYYVTLNEIQKEKLKKIGIDRYGNKII